MSSLFILIGLGLGSLLLAGLVVGRAKWRRRRLILQEDALKQIYSAEQEGRLLRLAELGERLRLSRQGSTRLVHELETAGLVKFKAGLPELTEAGERLGLHLLRGHRLWERYLSDEGHLPLEELHDQAERKEHHLSADDLEALTNHLGGPRTDPHGDPIPDVKGQFPRQERVRLPDWLPGRLAVVVHVEDEPQFALEQALLAGLLPGAVLRVLNATDEEITFETLTGQSTLARSIAAQVDVRPAVKGECLEQPSATLAGIELGMEAEVVSLSRHCTGLRRRRLLDLGFTAGVRVKAVLSNAGDEAHAYRIRDTLIALRAEEAEQVLVRPVGSRTSRHRNQQQAKP